MTCRSWPSRPRLAQRWTTFTLASTHSATASELTPILLRARPFSTRRPMRRAGDPTPARSTTRWKLIRPPRRSRVTPPSPPPRPLRAAGLATPPPATTPPARRPTPAQPPVSSRRAPPPAYLPARHAPNPARLRRTQRQLQRRAVPMAAADPSRARARRTPGLCAFQRLRRSRSCVCQGAT